MNVCPNLACPDRKRARRPAEFEDHVATCTECGTALRKVPEAAPVSERPSRAPAYAAIAIAANVATLLAESWMYTILHSKTGALLDALELAGFATFVALLFGILAARGPKSRAWVFGAMSIAVAALQACLLMCLTAGLAFLAFLGGAHF